jgi:hypothetical protein
MRVGESQPVFVRAMHAAFLGPLEPSGDGSKLDRGEEQPHQVQADKDARRNAANRAVASLLFCAILMAAPPCSVQTMELWSVY